MKLDDRIDILVGLRLRAEELASHGDVLQELPALTRKHRDLFAGILEQAAREGILSLAIYSELDRKMEEQRGR